MWLVLVILYFVSPLDLIPDFLGLPGRLDDVLVGLAGLYYMARNSAAGKRAEDAGREAGRRPAGGQGAGRSRTAPREEEPQPGGLKDPYEVLGVSREASFEEIRRRYRERLLEVHPDRVQHMGGEFRELAERKTLELNEAFGRIREARDRTH